MNKENIEITQMNMIKNKNDVIVGLTLSIFNEDGTLKANNYKLSTRISKEDSILKTIELFGEEVLARILEKR
ncbi:MAG: hypothetical protein MSA56_07270 [Clostridium sp.]|nr:hypothetical protein [Clostridium sp.]MCI7083196.1 hypothetical protein [Mycoplasmatota bacterium]